MNENVDSPLNERGLPYFEAMETGKDNDYVFRNYDRLISGTSRLYGLFFEDELVSIGGYTIFAKRYAMIGRTRRTFSKTLGHSSPSPMSCMVCPILIDVHYYSKK